ncbi:MAG: sel1 repeat family protein [Wenzhouxiangella sp.]|nr:MAG: sel1 repeat family protein [Wenzhouxiangella sp.]
MLPAFATCLLLAVPPAQADDFHYATNTPGYRLYLEGHDYLQRGFYFKARHRFKRAAYWADKLAQHDIGVMYYIGHGVDRDPALAWAWLKLASERGYPDMIETAAMVFDELSEAERERGQHILEETLLPEYGDAVAVDRTHQRMQHELRQPKRGRVGAYSLKSMTITDHTGQTHAGRDFFDPQRWDFHRVIEQEMEIFNALPRGNVSMRDLETRSEDDSKDDSKDDTKD